MKNAKRSISVLLAVLMCIGMLTGIVLPAAAETTTAPAADRFAAITATDEDSDGVFTSANAVFINSAFGKGDYTGTFTYKYGDGTTCGNGVTYELTFGENAFANLHEGIWKVMNAWNAADTTLAEYEGIDTVVLAPGIYGGGQWQPSQNPVFDLPTDWNNGSYDELFTLNVVGPQAGISPVDDSIDNANPQAANGRSNSRTTEACSTSTFWEPRNVQYVIDGMAFTESHNFYSSYAKATPYLSLVMKNIYHVRPNYQIKINNSAVATFRFSGMEANRNIEFENYYYKYQQIDGTADQPGECLMGSRIVMDNFYEDFTDVKYVSTQYNQTYQMQVYLTPSEYQLEGFLNEGKKGAQWITRNSTINNHAPNHWVRYKFGSSYKKDGTTYYHYGNSEKGAFDITFENNHFYNCGDLGVNIWGASGAYKDPATTPADDSIGDMITFQEDWPWDATTIKGVISFDFSNNVIEYTEAGLTDGSNGNGGTKAKTGGGSFFNIHANNCTDISEQRVNWRMADNTMIIPSTIQLSSGITLTPKIDYHSYSSLLILNEKNEVCSHWSGSYNVTDVYAGDDFTGGVSELFSIVDGSDMAIVSSAVNTKRVVNKTNAPNFTGSVMVVPQHNAASVAPNELVKFRGENVEFVKLLDKNGEEVTQKVNPNDVDGYQVVAKYIGKTTVCYVTITISIAPDSEYAFIDPTNSVTSYEFNGKTYTLDETNRFPNIDRNWKKNDAGTAWVEDSSSPYAKIKTAGKNVIVFLPGEHAFKSINNKGNVVDNYQFQFDAAFLGPQFGVSPVTDDFGLNAERDGLKKVGENNYSVDLTKEAVLKSGFLNVYITKASLYVDGLTFGGAELCLQAAEYGWGYARSGSITSIMMNNCFAYNLDAALIGGWSNARANMIAKQAVYMSEVYVAGLGSEKQVSLINLGAANVHVDHVYVENITTNCVFRTAASNGAHMLIHPQKATFILTNSKFTDITETYNFIYPNFGHNDPANKDTNWAGTVYAGNAEYFPGGFEQVYDNNIFENIASAKAWIVRATTPGTGDVYQRLQFTNNTVAYDAIPTDAGQMFFNPSAGNLDELVVEGNVMINVVDSGMAFPTLRSKEKTNVDENYWAVTADGAEKLVTVKAPTNGTKSDWYYIDRAMTVKNTEVKLVDNGYVSIEAAKFDGLNNATIDASESNLMGDVKAFFKAEEGATVEGVYSDAACTKAVTELTGGTVYVNVVKGDAALATKVALTVCDHEGTTSEDVTVEPTCTTEGSKTVTCSVCGKSWSESVAATNEHKFTELVSKTDATCKAEGSATYKCETCEATEDKTLEIDPTAHKWETEYTVDTPATCGTDGSKSYHCEYCDTVNADSVTAIPATGDHSYTVEQSKTEATCMATGTLVMKCANCDATETTTLEINKDNHTGNNTVVGKEEATCGESGYTGDTVCECGEIIAEGAEIPATEKHDYSVKQSETEATCMATGTLVMKCANCDATETTTLEIDKDNHTGNNTVVGKEEATCGESGYTGDTVCECGEIIAEGAEIPATGQHTPSEEITVVTPATPTTEGIGKKVCTVCGQDAELNIVIPATGPKGPVTIGDQAYESLEAALAAAKDDDVIVLHEDVQTGHLALDPEVTLDLNGNDLTAGYVIGFNTSAIIDTDGEGRVIVDKDKIALDQNNGGYLPVYDGEGYKLITITIQEIAVADDASDDIMYYFSPDLSQANAELLQGAAASGVKLVVRLSWSKAGEYNATQDYVYMDEMVKAVIESYNESADYYGLAFTALFDGTEAGNVEDLKVSAVIVSDAGTEVSSQGLALAE